MKFQFNTGRLYSQHGQRIVVEVLDKGLIFNDIDRGVSGHIAEENLECAALQPWDRTCKADIKPLLMWCYDHGHYNRPGQSSAELYNRASNLAWEG